MVPIRPFRKVKVLKVLYKMYRTDRIRTTIDGSDRKVLKFFKFFGKHNLILAFVKMEEEFTEEIKKKTPQISSRNGDIVVHLHTRIGTDGSERIGTSLLNHKVKLQM